MSRHKGNTEFSGTEEYTTKMGYTVEAAETECHLEFEHNLTFSFIV